MAKRKLSAEPQEQGTGKKARTISKKTKKTTIDDLAEELLEPIFRHVLHSIYPYEVYRNNLREAENRPAILRVCKIWYRIGTKLLWDHVSVNETESCWAGIGIVKTVKLSKLAAFTRALNHRPALGEEVKSLSLNIRQYIREDMITPLPSSITFLTNNLKSISIQIESLGTKDIHKSMDLLRDILLGVPLSCETFYLRIHEVTDDILDWVAAITKDNCGEKPILPDIIDSICMQCKHVRLELPVSLLKLIFTGEDDYYPRLESLVMWWTYLEEADWADGDSWTSCRNFVTAVATGRMPKLKRALIVRPDECPEFWNRLIETPFICVEEKVQLDNLFERPLFQMCKNELPDCPYSRWKAKEQASLQELGKERVMDRWCLGPGHKQHQPQIELKTFSFDSDLMSDMLLENGGIVWDRTPSGICVPRPLAIRNNIVEEEDSRALQGLVDADINLENHNWYMGLLLTVGGSC